MRFLLWKGLWTYILDRRAHFPHVVVISKALVFWGSYPSVEEQSVYSTVLVDYNVGIHFCFWRSLNHLCFFIELFSGCIDAADAQ